jgi:hypothetical protein
MAKKTISTEESSELLANLRRIVAILNETKDLVKGGMYHTISGAMQSRLEEMGLVSIPWLMLLAQEIGILRYFGGSKPGVWQVICITFFDEIVTPPWLERAYLRVEKHKEETRTLHALREQVTLLEARGASSSDSVPTGGKSLDEIASMVVKIEQLEAGSVSKDERIASLEQELAKQKSVDYDSALAEAIKRARGRQLT